MARLVEIGVGLAWPGGAVAAGHGSAQHGLVCGGMRRSVKVSFGRLGRARQGAARYGRARSGLAGLARSGM